MHYPERAATRILGMKLISLLSALVVFLGGLTAHAQDEALPSPEPQGATSTAQASVTPLPITPPPLLIPRDILALPEGSPVRPNVPAVSELDQGFKPAPLSPAAEIQRKHLEWRRLRNAVQNDRDIKAALQAATEARTDLEKRKLFGRYYDLFYDRMMARAAPDMKSYLLDRKREAVGALPQPRVRPGVTMSETAGVTPSPTVAPKPTPLFSAPGMSRLRP